MQLGRRAGVFATPALRIRSDQLGVERELSVVGEKLRDGAAGLGVGGSLVEDFLRGAGNAGSGSESDLGDGESAFDLGQGYGGVGFNLGRGTACSPELCRQS